MRNLKKVLALVVAVAMFASFGFVASAANFSDVATNASYADAVNLLSNLGIITGYEDGTFRPDNTVTRAEAATMMVRMLNLVDGVEDGDTIFTDVAADHWASGYVNVAVANGIVNGMGDGTFEPEGQVTYGQIVKMIVCALGYEPVALANGGWNGGGYIYAGSKAGFTKGVSGTANAAASRATVAKLIYNALEVELMDQTSFSTGINGSTYEVLEDQTILSEYLELEKVEGVIVETYLSNVDDYNEDANTVKMIITKNYAADAKYPVYDEKDLNSEEVYEFIADETDAATLLGYSVVAYVGENEDGDNTMFAVAEKAGKNTMFVLDTELVCKDSDGDKLFDETGVTYFKSSTSNAKVEAEIQAYVGKSEEKGIKVDNNVVVNGFNVYADAEDVFTEWEKLDEISLLDNDGDGDFEFIFATIPSEDSVEFVVEEVDVEELYVEGENGEVDFSDDEKLFTVIKDGKIVDIDAIAEGDVVTVLDESTAIITVYVSSTVLESEVDEVEGDVYTISGKEYELSSMSFDDDEKLSAGEEGLFYINAFGKIAYVDEVSSIAGADYVYIIDYNVEEGKYNNSDEYFIYLMTAAGAIEEVEVKAKNVVFEDENGFENKLTAEVLFETYLNVEGTLSGSKMDYEGYVGLARIERTAAGEIDAIYLPGAEDFVAEDAYENDAKEEDKYYNELRGTYGVVDLNKDALVFHIDTDVEKEDGLEEAITVTTVGNLFVDESSYSFIAYGEENEEAEVLVVWDAKASVNVENPVMVVTKIRDVLVDDDDDTVKLYGFVAGESVTVTVEPDTYTELLDDGEFPVEVGNVILYSEVGGYAEDVQVLVKSTDEFNADITVETGLEDIVSGVLGADEDDCVTINAAKVLEEDADEFSSKGFVLDGTKYYFADDVNVTVVDYSGASMTVKSGSTKDVKWSRNKEKVVFVKTALEDAEEVTDIVVFVYED